MEGKKMRARFILFAVTAFVLSIFVMDSSAQTKKKKTTAKRPKTVAVLPPVSGDAQVVSRADEYLSDDSPNGSQPPVADNTAQEPETMDQRLERANSNIKELNTRIQSLEAGKQSSAEDKKKGLLLNLDILTRAEQRAESLRKQLYEMIEKENTIKTKLDQIESDIRPEIIQRQVAMAGTLRPEELRDNRRKALEIERKNLQDLLTQMQTTKTSIESSVQRAELMVEKLRAKLEKDIDDALLDEPKNED
jgi:hypothetical protein